jgi:hypothetical protein
MKGLGTASAQMRYFAWLLAVVNLLQGTGYLLFSGVAGVADWAWVMKGASPAWLWRTVLALLGGVSYFLVLRAAMIKLGPFIGGDRTTRYRRALGLSLTAYIAGSALYIISGLLNPGGMVLVLMSAVAASLGGTCGFVWAPQLLLGDLIPVSNEGVTRIGRSWGWIGCAVIVAGLFICLLGPGIRFKG